MKCKMMDLVRDGGDGVGEKCCEVNPTSDGFNHVRSHGSASAATFEVCSLLVRLPAGGRLQRRFARSSLLQEAGQLVQAVLGMFFSQLL